MNDVIPSTYDFIYLNKAFPFGVTTAAAYAAGAPAPKAAPRKPDRVHDVRVHVDDETMLSHFLYNASSAPVGGERVPLPALGGQVGQLSLWIRGGLYNSSVDIGGRVVHAWTQHEPDGDGTYQKIEFLYNGRVYLVEHRVRVYPCA